MPRSRSRSPLNRVEDAEPEPIEPRVVNDNSSPEPIEEDLENGEQLREDLDSGGEQEDVEMNGNNPQDMDQLLQVLREVSLAQANTAN